MFTTKRMMFLYGFLVLVGGIAFYLFQQNKLSPEPIASDTVLKLVPKQEIPDETSRGQAGLIEKPPAEDPHAGHNHPPHEMMRILVSSSTIAVATTVVVTTVMVTAAAKVIPTCSANLPRGSARFWCTASTSKNTG